MVALAGLGETTQLEYRCSCYTAVICAGAQTTGLGLQHMGSRTRSEVQHVPCGPPCKPSCALWEGLFPSKTAVVRAQLSSEAADVAILLCEGPCFRLHLFSSYCGVRCDLLYTPTSCLGVAGCRNSQKEASPAHRRPAARSGHVPGVD